MKKTTVMIKFTHEEILDVLSEELLNDSRMTKKQKVLLGMMIIYSGLEQYKNEGYFFKDNKNLCNDCGISEPTLISGLVKLEKLGYIKRKIGSRGKASEYMLTDLVDAKLKVVNATETETDTLKNEGNFSNNFSKTDQNFSTDTETEKEGPSCISSFLLDPNIKVLLKESLNTLSLEIRKELACAYEERISKLEERLNKASNYTKELENRIQELEGKHINSVDQDNNTNVGTQEVEQEPKQGLKDISSTCIDQESGVCEANRMSTYDLISTVENSTDQDARKQAAKELQCRVNRHEVNGKQFGKAIAVLNNFNGVSSTSTSNPTPPYSADPLSLCPKIGEESVDVLRNYAEWNRFNITNEVFDEKIVDHLINCCLFVMDDIIAFRLSYNRAKIFLGEMQKIAGQGLLRSKVSVALKGINNSEIDSNIALLDSKIEKVYKSYKMAI